MKGGGYGSFYKLWFDLRRPSDTFDAVLSVVAVVLWFDLRRPSDTFAHEDIISGTSLWFDLRRPSDTFRSHRVHV